MLEIRNVVKHYRVARGDPVRAVDGVTLRAVAGELIALYGPSGSGKTTLIELVAATIKPDEGTILVDEQDIFSLSQTELDVYRLTNLGIIGGPDTLMPGATALANASLKLLLTKARNKRSTVEPMMIRLGLSERLNQRTEDLSMGERQRVSIARALVANPKLVLADEPTGNLDTALTRQVLELLRELCIERKVTVLLVTHDIRAAQYASQVYELRDGKLCSYEPDEILVPASHAGRLRS